jgi:hypothetical protein
METQITLPPEKPSTDIVVQPRTPLEMVALAIEKNAPIDTIERLVALAEKMALREAEGEFNDAMNRVQAKMQPIRTDCHNTQTNSRYASYRALDNALRPIYSPEGFSISYNTEVCDKPDTVRMLALVSRGQYTRTYRSADMPADGKGAKGGDVMTKTHASGAAMAYGMRYLLRMIFNIAIGEEDTDGNKTEEASDEDNEWLRERLDWISSSTANELPKMFGAAWNEAGKMKNGKAVQKRITEARDARKRELGIK